MSGTPPITPMNLLLAQMERARRTLEVSELSQYSGGAAEFLLRTWIAILHLSEDPDAALKLGLFDYQVQKVAWTGAGDQFVFRTNVDPQALVRMMLVNPANTIQLLVNFRERWTPAIRRQMIEASVPSGTEAEATAVLQGEGATLFQALYDPGFFDQRSAAMLAPMYQALTNNISQNVNEFAGNNLNRLTAGQASDIFTRQVADRALNFVRSIQSAAGIHSGASLPAVAVLPTPSNPTALATTTVSVVRLPARLLEQNPAQLEHSVALAQFQQQSQQPITFPLYVIPDAGGSRIRAREPEEEEVQAQEVVPHLTAAENRGKRRRYISEMPEAPDYQEAPEEPEEPQIFAETDLEEIPVAPFEIEAPPSAASVEEVARDTQRLADFVAQTVANTTPAEIYSNLPTIFFRCEGDRCTQPDILVPVEQPYPTFYNALGAVLMQDRYRSPLESVLEPATLQANILAAVFAEALETVRLGDDPWAYRQAVALLRAQDEVFYNFALAVVARFLTSTRNMRPLVATFYPSRAAVTAEYKVHHIGCVEPGKEYGGIYVPQNIAKSAQGYCTSLPYLPTESPVARLSDITLATAPVGPAVEGIRPVGTLRLDDLLVVSPFSFLKFAEVDVYPASELNDALNQNPSVQNPYVPRQGVVIDYVVALVPTPVVPLRELRFQKPPQQEFQGTNLQPSSLLVVLTESLSTVPAYFPFASVLPRGAVVNQRDLLETILATPSVLPPATLGRRVGVAERRPEYAVFTKAAQNLPQSLVMTPQLSIGSGAVSLGTLGAVGAANPNPFRQPFRRAALEAPPNSFSTLVPRYFTVFEVAARLVQVLVVRGLLHEEVGHQELYSTRWTNLRTPNFGIYYVTMIPIWAALRHVSIDFMPEPQRTPADYLKPLRLIEEQFPDEWRKLQAAADANLPPLSAQEAAFEPVIVNYYYRNLTADTELPNLLFELFLRETSFPLRTTLGGPLAVGGDAFYMRAPPLIAVQVGALRFPPLQAHYRLPQNASRNRPTLPAPQTATQTALQPFQQPAPQLRQQPVQQPTPQQTTPQTGQQPAGQSGVQEVALTRPRPVFPGIVPRLPQQAAESQSIQRAILAIPTVPAIPAAVPLSSAAVVPAGFAFAFGGNTAFAPAPAPAFAPAPAPAFAPTPAPAPAPLLTPSRAIAPGPSAVPTLIPAPGTVALRPAQSAFPTDSEEILASYFYDEGVIDAATGARSLQRLGPRALFANNANRELLEEVAFRGVTPDTPGSPVVTEPGFVYTFPDEVLVQVFDNSPDVWQVDPALDPQARANLRASLRDFRKQA